MQKVLVTGGTGFIGAKVTAELLQRGYEVHLTVYPETVIPHKNVVTHHLNLLDYTATDEFLAHHKFTHMLHLAWYVGAKCHISDLNMDWVMASLNLLRSFHRYGGKTFLGAGTVSEYEYQYGYLREDTTPTDPQTLYGNGKNAVFNVGKVFCAQNGIDFKWPRIFNLYGPEEKPQRLMPSVINACLKGDDVKVSNCLKYQDYLYVWDTARAIVDVFESNVTGAVNICSGTPVQLREIVNMIARLTEFKGNILWGALPEAFGESLVVGNNERLKSIGWTQHWSLEEGLKQTIEWWRQQNV